MDKLDNGKCRFNILKSKVDKLDIGKLETTLVDLSKLSNVLKNDVVKKTEYNELVKNVSNISTNDRSNLVKKTDDNRRISKIENRITTDYKKFITAQKLNKLTAETFAPRIAQANLASKTDIFDITDFVKTKDFDHKLKILNKILSYFK